LHALLVINAITAVNGALNTWYGHGFGHDYMAFLDHPQYIKEFFQMQTEIGLKNLELYRLYGLLSRRQFVTDGSFA
jgi:hypothetical protein